MSVPNLMRVGTTENVFVECQDCSGGSIDVTINVMNHPTKSKRLAQTSVTLNSENNFQGFGKVTVSNVSVNQVLKGFEAKLYFSQKTPIKGLKAKHWSSDADFRSRLEISVRIPP